MASEDLRRAPRDALHPPLLQTRDDVARLVRSHVPAPATHLLSLEALLSLGQEEDELRRRPVMSRPLRSGVIGSLPLSGPGRSVSTFFQCSG